LGLSIAMRASGEEHCVGRAKEGIDSHDGKPVRVELDGEIDVSPASGDDGFNSGNTVS
jgi:hypothetical protein